MSWTELVRRRSAGAADGAVAERHGWTTKGCVGGRGGCDAGAVRAGKGGVGEKRDWQKDSS